LLTTPRHGVELGVASLALATTGAEAVGMTGAKEPARTGMMGG
jgi:hypothetical protein